MDFDSKCWFPDRWGINPACARFESFFVPGRVVLFISRRLLTVCMGRNEKHALAADPGVF